MILADFAPIFAQLIARTAKDIDVLIESLPSEDASTELQVRIQTDQLTLMQNGYEEFVICKILVAFENGR